MAMVKVKPLQSVRLFGWLDQPRDIVMWTDIERRSISWQRLRREFGFSAHELFQIQPDKHEWIKRGGITIDDAPDMCIFPVNPISDLGMDLGELWRKKWPVDVLLKMSVTYEQMLDMGLSFNIMPFFDLSLASWCKLGFKYTHAQSLNPGLSFKLFGMPHAELLQILQSFQKNEATVGGLTVPVSA